MDLTDIWRRAELRVGSDLPRPRFAVRATPRGSKRPWADYRGLAAEMGLDVDRDGLVDPQARAEAEVELNALANELYAIDRAAFDFLIDTLFDTPAHRDAHFAARDAIVRWADGGKADGWCARDRVLELQHP